MKTGPAKQLRIGMLEVICGPMFSGKSEELIRRFRRAKIAKQRIVIFKHSLDNRHTLEEVVSHNGNSMDANPLRNPEDIIPLVTELEATVVGIDEVQFFDHSLIRVVSNLINLGKRVVVAGLDRDFRGAPFGPMPTLMAIADSVTKLQAICTLCSEDAARTQRLVNGQPAKFDDPIILVGAQEAYQARCRDCFIIDKQFTEKEL